MKASNYSNILTSQILEAEILRLRKSGNSLPSVKSILINQLRDIKPEDIVAYQDRIELEVKSYGSYKEAERIIASDICKTTNSDKYFVYDPATKTRLDYNLSSLSIMFNEAFLSKRTKVLIEAYDPYTDKVFLNLKGSDCFNMYKPAEWYAPYFYKQQKLGSSNIPAIHEEFFMHLVNNNRASYEFLLKWIAYSICNRNFTYLVTIGSPGIGKGMLYELIRCIHGEENSSEIRGSSFFNSPFNSVMENKTFFSIDEITRLKTGEVDQIKKLEASTVMVEKKGKDKMQVKNTLNIMLSSNDMAALSLDSSERRLSIIELTKRKIKNKWKGVFDEKTSELYNAKNIHDLGVYLLTQVKWTHEEMKEPHKAQKQIAEMNNSAILDWHDYFLFDFCQTNAGTTISLTDLIDRIKHGANNNRINVTRNILRSLSLEYEGIFSEVNMPGQNGRSGQTGFKIEALDKQPTKESFNLGTIIQSET